MNDLQRIVIMIALFCAAQWIFWKICPLKNEMILTDAKELELK